MLRVNIGLNRTLFGVLLAGLLIWLLSSLHSIVFELAVALGIAYILDPLVDRIERLVRSRGLAILLMLIPLLGLAALIGIWLVPALIEQIGTFLAGLPPKLSALYVWAKEIAESRFRFHTPKNFADLFNRYGAEIKDAAPSVLTAFKETLPGLFNRGLDVVRLATAAVLVPIFSLYLLYDFDRIVDYLRELLPRRYEPTIVAHARQIDQAVASFFRGQLTVCLILGTLYAIGYSIVGIELALVIGLGTGLLVIVPYVGAFLGFLTALTFALVALASGTGSGLQVLGVVIVFAIVQALDSIFITPRVLGHSVDLSPIFILIALMVGGSLLGFVGVLIAVPAAASLRVIGRSLVAWYKTTQFFVSGLSDDGESPAAGLHGSPAVSPDGAPVVAPAPASLPLAEPVKSTVVTVEASPSSRS